MLKDCAQAELKAFDLMNSPSISEEVQATALSLTLLFCCFNFTITFLIVALTDLFLNV